MPLNLQGGSLNQFDQTKSPRFGFSNLWALLFWFAPTYPILVSKVNARTTFLDSFFEQLKLFIKVVQTWTTFRKSCPEKLSKLEQLFMVEQLFFMLNNFFGQLSRTYHFEINSNLEISARVHVFYVFSQECCWIWTTFLDNFYLNWTTFLNNFHGQLLLFKKVVQNKKSCPTSCSRKLSETKKVV